MTQRESSTGLAIPAVLPPPSPPRPITAGSRRRAWLDPQVRFWWLVAACIGLFSTGLFACGITEWHRENWLLQHGAAVEATVLTADGEVVKGKHRPPDGRVTGMYEWDGQRYSFSGILKNREDFIEVGSTILVHIDPSNPHSWTGVTAPAHIEEELLGAVMVLPAALAAFAVSLMIRSRLLRVWRDGQAIDAVLLESRPTAIAPRLRSLRCVPADGKNSRVVSVYAPSPLLHLNPGDHLWLLVTPSGSGRVVAASWFL